MSEIEGFAALERATVRRNVPGFDWRTFTAPSPRHRLTRPLGEATIGLISTSGARVADQLSFDVVSDEGDPSYRAIPRETPPGAAAVQPRGLRRPQRLCRPGLRVPAAAPSPVRGRGADRWRRGPRLQPHGLHHPDGRAPRADGGRHRGRPGGRPGRPGVPRPCLTGLSAVGRTAPARDRRGWHPHGLDHPGPGDHPPLASVVDLRRRTPVRADAGRGR